MLSGTAALPRVREFLREEYDRAFRHDHWHVGIVDAPIHAFLEETDRPAVRWLPLPERGKYFADPFGLRRGNTTEIFLEEYDFRTDKGVIRWIREDGEGQFSTPTTILDLAVHASYPFLLERGGSTFCIPETARAREISLFRANEFPRHWTRAATLVRGLAAVDSTVIERDGLFWLFCTDLHDGPFSKLRIWYAHDLFGPWTPHPENPVKDDMGSARPAGTPFLWRGELYRPAQDCSSTYGGSVVLNRVLQLSTTSYREEPAMRVGPFHDGGHDHGIHTLSSIGDRTLVDGKRLAFNRQAMARNLHESVATRWPKTLRRG